MDGWETIRLPFGSQLILQVASSCEWWLNQPIWKICSWNWIISTRIRVKLKNRSNHHLDNHLAIWTLPFPFWLTWKSLHLVLSSGGEPVRGGEVPLRGGERGEVPCRSAIGWWFFPKAAQPKNVTHIMSWYIYIWIMGCIHNSSD